MCVESVGQAGRRRRHGVIKTATAKSSSCDTVSRGEQRSWWQYLGLSCCTNEDRTALSTHQQPRSHSSSPCARYCTRDAAPEIIILCTQMLSLSSACAKRICMCICIWMHNSKCSRLKTIKSRKCIVQKICAALDAMPHALVFCLSLRWALVWRTNFAFRPQAMYARGGCVGLI